MAVIPAIDSLLSARTEVFNSLEALLPNQAALSFKTLLLREVMGGTGTSIHLQPVQYEPDNGTEPPDGDSGVGNIGAAFWGTSLPKAANVTAGQGSVEADTALEILRNLSDGKPPFKPELGRIGGVSWFVTKGNPYTGVRQQNPVIIPVEIGNPTGGDILTFQEADLTQIYDAKYSQALRTAEDQWRESHNLGSDAPFSNTAQRRIERQAKGLAERLMWEEVGRRVKNSESGVGRVILENSRFSRNANGEFMLTSRANAVHIKGGTQTLLNLIREKGTPAEPGLVEKAQQLAQHEKWAGRVQGAFRIGGRVMIVVGLAADAYRIYMAEDKVKETVKVVGGWSGALALGSTAAAVTAPADAAGPVGWAFNGLVTLGAGAVGYFAGEKVAEKTYELVVHNDPIDIAEK